MITIKLDPKLSASAGISLERHAQTLYARPGMRMVGVVELRQELEQIAKGLETALSGEPS